MNYLIRLSWVCILLLGITGVASGAAKRMIMEEGQSRIVTAGFLVEKIATGNPAVCRGVKVGENEVLINAQTTGKSNIIIIGADGQRVEYAIQVKSVEAGLTAAELRAVLSGIEGVKVRKAGRQVILEGEILSQTDLENITQMIKDLPNVVNMLELSPLVKEVIKNEIQEAIAAEKLGNVRVTVVKNNFVLLGVVGHESHAQMATNLAAAFSPNIINALTVDTSRPDEEFVTIEMQLNIMEIEKSLLKDLGIHWNPLSKSGARGSYSGEKGKGPTYDWAITGAISDLFPKMRRVFEDGKGRSLIEQSVVTKSGGEADFFVGTEYPVLVPQQGGMLTVEYKDVGVRMNFKPVLRRDNYITSPVNITSSAITGEAAIGMPIISSTELSTVVNLVSGTSIALAGLVGRKELDNIMNSPPGNDISLLQANKGSQNEKTSREVIVFITPQIIGKYEDAAKSIGKEVRQSFKKKELKMLREAYQDLN
jgi:pilus assembly protein CpaC